MIEWKIHSYNRDVITYFFNFVFAFKRNNIFVPSLNISHTRRTLRIFFQFTKTYRTTGSQTRNCEKLVEICIARHMPGLTRPWTFARDDDHLPLSPPSFIRASSFRSWDPFLRERFVIVYRIVYPIHGTLSPPGPFLETLSGDSSLRRISMRQRRGGAWGASKCIEIYEPTPPLPSPRALESEAERLMPRFLGWISRWEREKCCDAILSSPVRESREIQSVHVRTLGNKRSLWMVRLISREREKEREIARLFREHLSKFNCVDSRNWNASNSFEDYCFLVFSI